MSTSRDIKVFLTDSVLEMNNLEQVFRYLWESTGKQVRISDYKGTFYTSDQQNGGALSDEYYSLLSKWNNEERYFYDERSRTLFYRVGFNEKDGFILVEEIDSEDIEACKELLDQASLAVKTYLTSIYSMENLENHYINSFLTDVLIRNINIKDIIKQNYAFFNFDNDNLYYITIMVTDKILTERELLTVRSYTKEWLKSNDLDIFCTCWESQYIVTICPSHYNKQVLDIDCSWDKHISNITRYHEEVTRKFNFKAILAIGNKYSLCNLHRSYQEALFALHLSDLMGKGNRVRHISDLGVFSLICSNEVTDLKFLCNKHLGCLLAHDKINNSMFLDTLRCYFDTNINIMETADKLFLHINTLRYRLKRIEELTKTSLNNLEDRTNLFVALKIYDVMVRLNLTNLT